jgi:hypothetical protein
MTSLIEEQESISEFDEELVLLLLIFQIRGMAE